MRHDPIDKRPLNSEHSLESLGSRARESRKVVIVGAGQVGATFAFTLMQSGLANTIVLIDVNAELVEGHVMDLNHGRSFVPPVTITTGDYSTCRQADIVVVTAGAGQKPGETRLDLVQKNTQIFQDMIPKIVQYNPGILLIVTNPVDILTYVTLKLSGYPTNRVIGSGTVLDTSRFRSLLSQHCEVDARNVHAYVIGEHGDSEVAVWSQANIAGITFDRYCPTCQKQCSLEDKEAIFRKVKHAAYEIIQRKGATNFAVSLALLRVVESILRDEHSVLTVATLLDDYYGVSDVCLSVPAILDRHGVSKILNIELNEQEVEQFQHSANVLKAVMTQVGIERIV
jgi:L-lactate dehydrogenase